MKHEQEYGFRCDFNDMEMLKNHILFSMIQI